MIACDLKFLQEAVDENVKEALADASNGREDWPTFCKNCEFFGMSKLVLEGLGHPVAGGRSWVEETFPAKIEQWTPVRCVSLEGLVPSRPSREAPGRTSQRSSKSGSRRTFTTVASSA